MKRIAMLVVWLVPVAGLIAENPKTDAQGDPLPAGAIARLGTVRWRAGSALVMAAYQPDGRSVVAVSSDFTAHVWDAVTGREIRHFDLSGGATVNFGMGGRAILAAANAGAAISGDGTMLACGGRDGAMRVFDIQSGKETRKFTVATGGGLNRVALSHDGALIAIAGYPQPIHILETATGKQVRQLALQEDGRVRFFPYRVEFGKDGKGLFVAGLEFAAGPQAPLVSIWEVATGKIQHRLNNLPNLNNGRPVSYLAVASPDLKTAAVPLGEEIALYDMTTGKELRKIKYNADYRTTLQFTSDGKSVMAITGKADALATWDVATGKLVRQIGKPPEALAAGAAMRTANLVTLSPDGKTLALLDGPAIAPLDATTGKPKHADFGHSAALKEATFLRDGKTVLTRAADNSILRWDSDAGKIVGSFAIPSLKETPSFILPSPDGKLAATGDNTGILRVYDPATGKELYTVSIEGVGMTVGFSPDSRTVAVVPRVGSTAQIFDAATGTKRFDLSLPVPVGPPVDPRFGFVNRNANRRLIFSSNSRLVGVGSEGFLTIWDTVTGAKMRMLPLSEGKFLRHAAISPDGFVVAMEYTDGETALCEIASATARLTLIAGTPAPAMNPNLAVLRIINDPAQFHQSLAFAPDGRVLARSGDDGKILLWDVRNGKEIGSFEGHRGTLVSAEFSPDGSRLVTASTDTTALVWDAVPLRANLANHQAPIGADRLEDLWNALGESDGNKAYAAIQALSGDPAKAVDLLRKRVRPVEAPDPQRIAKLVGDLSDVRFLTREKAQKELANLGELAIPALRDAVENAAPQVRRQAAKLLELLENRTFTSDQLRSLRAIEVLELAKTPDALALLKLIAAGAPEAVPTPQAKSAVERLK